MRVGVIGDVVLTADREVHDGRSMCTLAMWVGWPELCCVAGRERKEIKLALRRGSWFYTR